MKSLTKNILFFSAENFQSEVFFYRKVHKVFLIKQFCKNTKFTKLSVEPALRTFWFLTAIMNKNLSKLCGKKSVTISRYL
ncbi:hypothetical protein EAH81_09005 [Flavobacterium pectinovorum]|uniref:Uncharacterized protein n=1 Tax=Flavobacterium pectinovorum TaxID=29533 RepID=A0A502EY27_9FLAO|nr:hypothetical protein EAH81_09005 [Flavobacterium pectinovorum]